MTEGLKFRDKRPTKTVTDGFNFRDTQPTNPRRTASKSLTDGRKNNDKLRKTLANGTKAMTNHCPQVCDGAMDTTGNVSFSYLRHPCALLSLEWRAATRHVKHGRERRTASSEPALAQA